MTLSSRIHRFLSHLSYPLLIVVALLLGLAPFRPEPHLLEKLRMLREGALTRPLDIFDFFFHLFPLFLLLLKIAASQSDRRG